MSQGTLFLILPESNVAKVEAFVRELIVPKARNLVHVLSDAPADTFGTDVNSRTARHLIDRISGFAKAAENRLFIGHEARCSVADLEDWWAAHDFGNPNIQKLKPVPLKREIKAYLESRGLDWRSHADLQVRNFEGPPAKLEQWLSQFGQLGHTRIGQKLAAQIRVMKTSDLANRSFSETTADLVGHRRLHCYVQDDDNGGSWVEMQALLTHAFAPTTVGAVKWDKASGQLTFPEKPVDEFVLYEDGLWSGKESIERLRAIKNAPISARITLRFGVVSDFGLSVVRQAIRSLGLGSIVSVDASRSELFHFLKTDVAEDVLLGLEANVDGHYDGLHEYVQPYAFAVQEDWSDSEIGVCREIGKQLVRNWRFADAGQPPDELVDLFALGGGRFASTILFSRSVPKVCLPLIWLDGTVQIGEKTVLWKPLFVDARRVSNKRLLVWDSY